LNLICKDFEHKAKKFEYAEKLEIKRSEKAWLKKNFKCFIYNNLFS
jgi:hypothetical protein